MGEVKNTYSILIETSEGNNPLRRPRFRWKDNVKVDIEYEGMD
jgi:hypothetical protein